MVVCGSVIVHGSMVVKGTKKRPVERSTGRSGVGRSRLHTRAPTSATRGGRVPIGVVIRGANGHERNKEDRLVFSQGRHSDQLTQVQAFSFRLQPSATALATAILRRREKAEAER